MSHDRAPGSPAGPQSWPDDTEFHLPEDHWPLPELVHTEKPHAEPSGEAFREVAASPEYATLRSTFRGFAFPMTIAGLVSYFVFVLLSIYAVDFMKQPFLGMEGLTLGFVLALVQFAVVWIWTALYVNFANKRIDPIAGQLKARLENGTRA
jgi:uncharacterized membrane protein (DUF485 family)